MKKTTFLICAACVIAAMNSPHATSEIDTTQETYEDVQEEISTDTIKVRTVTHVHLTCYQPVEAQCDSSPLVTADGSSINLAKLRSGDIKWVAISPDLLWLIPMGSKVRITSEKTGECYGVFEVRDKMNRRWDHRMDILIHPSDNKRISEKHVKIEVLDS